MKTTTTPLLLLVTCLSMGCSNNKVPDYISQATYSGGDAAPREGWATDPNLSYRIYSYYPYNFTLGGFGPYGPTGFNRFGF